MCDTILVNFNTVILFETVSTIHFINLFVKCVFKNHKLEQTLNGSLL